MSRDEYAEANFPFTLLSQIDQDGVIDRRFSSWITAHSSLTGAGFKVRAILPQNADGRPRVIGYQVKINPPACLIGNNYLLENRVLPAARAIRRLLQHWLLKNGCSPSGIKAISLKRASLNSVTLTYLIRCANSSDAKAALRELYLYAAALHNKPYRTRELRRSPVYKVGADESITVYCKPRQFTIVAYVKERSIEGSFSKFDSASDEKAVQVEAGRFLRMEIELHGEWLGSSGNKKPQAWCYTEDNNPYHLPFELIRDYLRLDKNLRIRRPKPDQMESLSVADQEILNWHLEGHRVSDHPLLLGKDRTKYYPVQSRILKKTRIDIGIPWKVQNNDLSPRMNQLMRNPGQYRPLKQLAHVTFSRITLDDSIRRLDELIGLATPTR